ncbi:MAG: hypothetical protein E6R13_04015 [Spirochaetes bacterium]|nr:MAG: hypothetical protein E6R13_04015 [Spirochaetota bacterium]
MTLDITTINKVYLVCTDIDCGYHVLEAHFDKNLAEERLQYFQLFNNTHFIEEVTIGELNHLQYLGKKSLYIVPFGSGVYGTNDSFSDLDFYVINNDTTLVDAVKEKNSNIEYKFIKVDDFQNALNNQDIQAIEVYFCSNYLAKGNIHNLQRQFTYTVDKQKIRRVFSQKSSNSWVKCKKKLTVEIGQERIALKSLFHSFRILYFGIQLCTHGKIIDYTEANFIYDEIKNIGGDWEKLESYFKPLYNSLSTEFKKVAPK